jgi:hypothetical protein
MVNKIVTGERVQQLCDVYFGFEEDFRFNPIINQQHNKHFNLNNLNNEINNPYYIFCYSHRIKELSNKIHLFKNKFVLITHNSDGEIRAETEILKILNYPNLDKWYAQNICFENPKLHFLPIGIANSQWPHGNINMYNNEIILHNSLNKSKIIYFNFNIDTNRSKRTTCFNSLKNKLLWLDNISPSENIVRLSQYNFCICPEGNGFDTHRLWEALYVKTVPIVIQSEFTKILQKNNVPLVILNTWDDLNVSNLNYNDYNFNNYEFLKITDLYKLFYTFSHLKRPFY